MTSDNRYDAALRAHAFHRPFLEGIEGGDAPAAPPPDQPVAEPPSQDFASELEASLMRNLNALNAGLRPKKLLPERTEPPPVTPERRDENVAGPPAPMPKLPTASWPAAAEAARTSPYAPPPKLPRAAPPIPPTTPTAEAKEVNEKPASPYAPQTKRPTADSLPGLLAKLAKPVGAVPQVTTEEKPVSRYAPPKRPNHPGTAPRGETPVPLEPSRSPKPEAASNEAAVSGEEVVVPAAELDAAPARTSGEEVKSPPTAPVAQITHADGTEADGDDFDGPSADELAKLYAPRPPPETAAAQPKSEPPVRRPAGKGANPYAPRRIGKRVTAAPGSIDASRPERPPQPKRTAATIDAGDGGKPRPIRWQANDELPRSSLFKTTRGVSWTSKAALAVVFVGLIGGVGAVVTLESLSAPEPEPGVVASDRVSVGSAAAAAGPRYKPVGNRTVAARVPAGGVEVIHADDAGSGLAPSEGVPLPGSAKVIPLPQPVTADVALRSTNDAGDNGDTGSAAAANNGDAAPAAAADPGDDPAADAVDAAAGAGDRPVGPPPRAPKPRPDHEAPPEGVLAYAPSTEPVDRGAKALAGKSDGKTAAKPPISGSARIVSWVNMRSSADNKAATVKVLPAGSVVTVIKCNFWCEIVADGKRGFVYKSFLKTIGATASDQ